VICGALAPKRLEFTLVDLDLDLAGAHIGAITRKVFVESHPLAFFSATFWARRLYDNDPDGGVNEADTISVEAGIRDDRFGVLKGELLETLTCAAGQHVIGAYEGITAQEVLVLTLNKAAITDATFCPQYKCRVSFFPAYPMTVAQWADVSAQCKASAEPLRTRGYQNL